MLLFALPPQQLLMQTQALAQSRGQETGGEGTVAARQREPLRDVAAGVVFDRPLAVGMWVRWCWEGELSRVHTCTLQSSRIASFGRAARPTLLEAPAPTRIVAFYRSRCS